MTNPNLDPMMSLCDLKWNYPIFNLERGEFRSCCRTPGHPVSQDDLTNLGPDAFLNSPKMLESRLEMINGIRTEDCNSCWKLEDSYMQSPRHKPIQFFHHMQTNGLIDKSIIFSQANLRAELKKNNDINSPLLKSYNPYMLEISLGNTCDMKCMYCSHHYSTQWAAEKIKFKEITQEQYDEEFPKAPSQFLENFWLWFDTVKHKLDRIGIIGGEPLIMPEFYILVDQLIERVKPIVEETGKKPIFWLVTNMNTPPNYLEKFFHYLPKLTETFDLEILVSMESLGKKAEYIRNGVNWERFTGNLDKLLSRNDLKFDFGFILSINALSITSLEDFIRFTEKLYDKYQRPVALKHNIISYPDWQSPYILTSDFADYVDNCIEYMRPLVPKMPIVKDIYGRWSQYIAFLENLSASIRNTKEDKTELRKKFVEWFSMYDNRRKLDLLSTFPELTKFYEMCESLD